MRNRLFYTVFLAVAISLSGCGPGPVEEQLKQDVELLKEQATIAYLNKQIEQSYGNQSFLLAPGQLLIVSPGVNNAFNRAGKETESFAPMEIISAARRYNAARVTCKVLDVNSSPIREKKDSAYPYQVKLTISVDVTYDEDPISGVSVHAVTPFDWDNWNSERQKEFVQALYSKLLPAEFDYRVVAEAEFPHTETIREDWPEDAVWNKNTGHWEIVDAPAKVNAPAPPWNTSGSSEEEIRRRFESQGMIAYNNMFFSSNDDIELAKKLDAGQVYVGGKWQNLAFSTALKNWNRTHSFSALSQMVQELRSLPESDPLFAEMAALARDGILNSIQEGDGEFLKHLEFYMKENSSFSAISPDRILAAIHDAQKNRNKKMLAEMIEKQNALRQMEGFLVSFAPNRLSSKSKSDFEQFRKIAESIPILEPYVVFFSIIRGDLSLAGKIKSDSRFADLCQVCQRCDGRGQQVCRQCKGTGVCPLCNGAGWRVIQTVTGPEEVSCSPRCLYCPKSPVCPSCHGTGVVFFRAKAAKRATDSYAKIMQELQEEIQSCDETISLLREQVAE